MISDGNLEGARRWLVRDIVRAGYVGQPTLPVIVHLVAYFDDSRSSGSYVLAGYAASIEVWDGAFAEAWKLMLDESPHPITEYKHADCRRGSKEFRAEKGWTKPERDVMQSRAVSIIGAHLGPKFAGFGAALAVPEFEAPESESVSFDQNVTLLSAQLLGAARGAPLGDSVQFVFDIQRKYQGAMLDAFEDVRERMGAELQCRIKPLMFAESKELLPLQAADVLAYETRRELQRVLHTPEKPRSYILSKLLDQMPHRAVYMDIPTWKGYWDAIDRGLEADACPDPKVLYSVGFSSSPN